MLQQLDTRASHILNVYTLATDKLKRICTDGINKRNVDLKNYSGRILEQFTFEIIQHVAIELSLDITIDNK
jgi:hypothetical protein